MALTEPGYTDPIQQQPIQHEQTISRAEQESEPEQLDKKPSLLSNLAKKVLIGISPIKPIPDLDEQVVSQLSPIERNRMYWLFRRGKMAEAVKIYRKGEQKKDKEKLTEIPKGATIQQLAEHLGHIGTAQSSPVEGLDIPRVSEPSAIHSNTEPISDSPPPNSKSTTIPTPVPA